MIIKIIANLCNIFDIPKPEWVSLMVVTIKPGGQPEVYLERYKLDDNQSAIVTRRETIRVDDWSMQKSKDFVMAVTGPQFDLVETLELRAVSVGSHTITIHGFAGEKEMRTISDFAKAR